MIIDCIIDLCIHVWEFLNTLQLNNKIFFLGFVTDGEFNSLRTQGAGRPVSVIQLIMDSRSEARSTASRQIESYLKPIRRGIDVF